MSWEFIQQIFLILGGLGLFLYGMKMMSDGLQKLAGDRMRSFIKRTTSNRFLGVLTGTGLTAIIQSSTATTIMVISFINAGMITLAQATGVIMGANIGTTLTAQMMTLKIDAIAPLIIFVGLIMHMFFKKRTVRNIGYILLGLGILFFGISVMGSPFKEFSNNPSFQSMLTTFENPLLALLAGLIFTAIIQSSTATIGIVVAMYLGGVDLPFETAAFIVLGTNVGTCLTAVVASIPTGRDGKRAALIHVLFNIIGCAIFTIVLLAFPSLLTLIQETWTDGARQVAMFHSLFSIITTIILIGFVKQLTNIAYKIIPVLPDETNNSKQFIHLNSDITKKPDLAIAQAGKEVCRIGNLAYDNLKLSLEALNTRDQKIAMQVVQNEETINFLYQEIKTWLIGVRCLELSQENLEKSGMMLRSISDIERIGDYAENIAENVLIDKENKIKLPDVAIEELNMLGKKTLKIIRVSLAVYESDKEEFLPEVEGLEGEIISMFQTNIENHMRRLEDSICSYRGGVLFTDIAQYLKRCANHATNIAFSILSESEWCKYKNKPKGNVISRMFEAVKETFNKQ